MKNTLKIYFSKIKKNLVTFGGLRKKFKIRLLGTYLIVDYNLNSTTPDRDYAIILYLTKGKKCIFDVGANHGVVSLLIAQQNREANIYAFEASENAVNIINHNVELNNLSNRIKVINTLIADKSGMTMPFYWKDSSGGASITKGRLGHHREIEKSTLSLDDFVANNSIKPDFIKIDIEGAESLAVRGLLQTIEKHRPEIFIELHSFGELSLVDNARQIFDSIISYSYYFVYLRTGQPIHDMEILADRGRCHILLSPVETFDKIVLPPSILKGL
ncbi:MAG: FkbM family methyltransferase [Chitinophagales bacterium]|nr:FkbM family methyltransferase [Chitinophagales bacterium]MDW8274723.1 FkbM family methyltransferase [Chitinophagales bacterium]